LVKTAPGVIVSVRDGSDRKVLAIGDAARDPERKLTPEDTVMIASVTKALVATAALSLVQDGSIRLDDTVEKWLPGELAEGREINVEHLLSMSSGLPNYEDSPDFPGPGVLPAKALVGLIAERPLDFAPGTQGAQSNSNYAALQLILERAGRAPLDELLKQRVLKPAGLTHTMLGGTPTAFGYDGDQDATIRDPENPSVEFPRYCGVLSTCGESAAVRMDTDAEDEACLSGILPAGGVGVGPSGPLGRGRRRELGRVGADAAQLAPPSRA
jgi:D-alanyl-D-alanine carboxypeptidase